MPCPMGGSPDFRRSKARDRFAGRHACAFPRPRTGHGPPLSPSCRDGSNSPMAEGDPIRIIPHRGVDDDCGSLEVWFADGRKSIRFYWDNLVSRRLSGNTLTREQAIEKATALAKAEMDALELPPE